MTKLLAAFAVSLLLSCISEQNTRAALADGRRYSVWRDGAYVLLLVVLTLFAGLRTSYNDTGNYISSYAAAPTLAEFFSEPENFNIFKNPLFFAFRSLLKSLGCDAQMLILITSFLTQASILRFLKRYSQHFTFSVFLYFTLGTFAFTLAALKQVLAMAVAVLAFPQLEKRHWLRYYLIIFLAMLFHTYALAFAVLPFFAVKPWRSFTFLFVAAMVVLMMNFEATITAFMEQANDLGKSLADYEVFDDATINLFRLSVYAVTPLISLAFQRWALRRSTRMDNVLIHMSIISLAFMSMGMQSGANMFARMATYFELGTLCCLPNMLSDIFARRSYRLVAFLAVVCFFGFFVYDNAVRLQFDQEYQAMSLWQFLMSL